jgi:hypothetical protein
MKPRIAPRVAAVVVRAAAAAVARVAVAVVAAAAAAGTDPSFRNLLPELHSLTPCVPYHGTQRFGVRIKCRVGLPSRL